jgi:hypothetical protein
LQQLLQAPAATPHHQACGVGQRTNPHVAWLLPLTSTAAQVVAFVFQPQPLVLLLNYGAKVVVVVAAAAAELDRMADKAAHTDGLLVQQADRIGLCVLVFAIAIAQLAPYALAHRGNMPEFASATVA